jgi:zinc transporter 9
MANIYRFMLHKSRPLRFQTTMYRSTYIVNKLFSTRRDDGDSSLGESTSLMQERIHFESSRKVVTLALSGNLIITSFKFACWMSTGSSAMLSEAIHSLVDSGNQALLLIGLRGAQELADSTHQYGYGKSVYFWSLVSALGTFWCGAGISMWTSINAIIHPVIEVGAVGPEVWSVLALSFLIDGAVLYKTLQKVNSTKPKNISLIEHLRRVRDPTTMAVILEDAAACLGVIIAVCGIGAVHFSHIAVFDGIAGVHIAGLLGGMGFALARLNQRYLLGYSVDPVTIEGIKNILISRKSIEEVHSVQSQWVGPYAFSYKAEVDFDGTFIAARLMHRYQSEFQNHCQMTPDETKLLLSWYAEDVIRAVESEVKDLEREIRMKYPEALYIELEPDGQKYSKYAIDDGRELSSRRSEMEYINQLEASFLKDKETFKLLPENSHETKF